MAKGFVKRISKITTEVMAKHATDIIFRKPVMFPVMPAYHPIKLSWWEKCSDRLRDRWQDFRERLGSKIAGREFDEGYED
jgi:hypothetical protein